MFYFGTSLAWLVFKKADLCLPVKQLPVQTQWEDAGTVFLKFRTQQSQVHNYTIRPAMEHVLSVMQRNFISLQFRQERE